MLIEIWSDYACPFCYIGKRRLETALDQFEHKDQVEVVYRSFELEPDAPKKRDVDVHDMISTKYGMSREKAQQMNEQLGQQASAEGLDFRFDSMKLTNTFDAHRLTHFASEHGKRAELTELLFKAYFTESKNVGDHETLLAIATEAGLDREATATMLASDKYSDEVRADEQDSAELGVRGVPFYVIDRKIGVSGAQPSNVFAEVLEKMWNEQNK